MSSLTNETQKLIDFHCVYCNRLHPMDYNTDEHIVPEGLYNKNYVLLNACSFINNYMAHSFENRVMKSPPVEEIKLMIRPPKKPIHRRKIPISLGFEVAQTIFPSGECNVVQLPQYISSDIIDIAVKASSGESVYHKLKLPFPIINITGSPRFINPDRAFKKFEQVLLSYLKSLSENPSLDPVFENFLKENGATFDSKEFKIAAKETKNPQIIIPPEELAIKSNIDDEALYKLFFKIAWTHGAKQLGRNALSNPIAEWIFSYITSGHIKSKKLIRNYPDLCSNSIAIENQEYFFWKYGINETLDWIEKNTEEGNRNYIMHHHIDRVQQFNIASQFIKVSNPIDLIDNTLRARSKEFSFHELGLKTLHVQGTPITVCSIKLFGGILTATVQLSQTPLTEIYPKDIIIKL